ncbi:hypothetical protein GGR50DRAFT_699385 [Xylaria sp. CBS 124048]|nr:hypothetical protein GGR50DRAFT_699385 [Xylaria sp. CBS 124048]
MPPKRVTFADQLPPSAFAEVPSLIDPNYQTPSATDVEENRPGHPAASNNGSNNSNRNGHHQARTAPPSTQTGTVTVGGSSPNSQVLFWGGTYHNVQNTPFGLIIDGLFYPRGPNGRTDLSGMNNPGPGGMPNPNAAHFQPPVPDTTNGPFQYTYIPRVDAPVQNQAPPPGAAPHGQYPSLFYYVPGAYPYPQARPGMATAPIPLTYQQAPYPGQPGQPGQPGYPGPVNSQPATMQPMNCGHHPGMHQATPPAGTYYASGTSGGYELGRTRAEVMAANQARAARGKMNEPQDMKPADDDISRMYWARETDGEWTVRTRYSLDRCGNFRWYVTESGIFYAVILPE